MKKLTKKRLRIYFNEIKKSKCKEVKNEAITSFIVLIKTLFCEDILSLKNYSRLIELTREK